MQGIYSIHKDCNNQIPKMHRVSRYGSNIGPYPFPVIFHQVGKTNLIVIFVIFPLNYYSI